MNKVKVLNDNYYHKKNDIGIIVSIFHDCVNIHVGGLAGMYHVPSKHFEIIRIPIPKYLKDLIN